MAEGSSADEGAGGEPRGGVGGLQPWIWPKDRVQKQTRSRVSDAGQRNKDSAGRKDGLYPPAPECQ